MVLPWMNSTEESTSGKRLKTTLSDKSSLFPVNPSTTVKNGRCLMRCNYGIMTRGIEREMGISLQAIGRYLIAVRMRSSAVVVLLSTLVVGAPPRRPDADN